MMTIPKQEKKNDNNGDTAAKHRVPLSFPQRVSILIYEEGRIMVLYHISMATGESFSFYHDALLIH